MTLQWAAGVDDRQPTGIDCGMRLCVLSSGSKQNCFYVESDDAAFLIDMGVSYRALRRMLGEMGRQIGDIDGIFISHEHSDHTRGLQTLVKSTEIPIYIHVHSARRLGLPLPYQQELQAHSPITIADITIQPFPVSHDAANTFGFRLTHGGRSLFLASDLGVFTPKLLEFSAGCHAIAIESNYDEDTLWGCQYPWYLKRRISSDTGHLSNADAVRFLHGSISADTAAVFMLHLSENSNSRAQVQAQIDTHLVGAYDGVRFLVSHRDQALPVVEI